MALFDWRLATGTADAPEGGNLILAAVINWNGWHDTVVCLQSILMMSGPPFHLIICDNGSTDGSHEQFCLWARQALGPSDERHVTLGDGAQLTTFERTGGQSQHVLLTVHVMALSSNLGYAGAINCCINWGRDALVPEYFWLLNNDVSVDSEALHHLVEAVRSESDIGLCGSVLLDWDLPHRVQALGGVFKPWPAVGVHLKSLPGGDVPTQKLFFDIDYPVGASLLVTREFVQAVGLMDEEYFLYYEEVDWAFRARAHGFRPAVALRSRVRHKEGASTGSIGGVRSKSMLAEHYGVVNRLRFTGKFYPQLVPAVWMSLLLVVLDRAMHGEWLRAGLVLRLMFEPRSAPRP